MQKIVDKLKEKNLSVKLNEPMKNHTTFKIGGNADVFVVPENTEQLIFAIMCCIENNVPYYVIGNGSNLLVGDKGYRGVIIQLFKNFSSIRVDGEKINVTSGAMLSAVAKTALDNSLCGMEFASGIPGTVGGAVCMNAGAYGGEMKDIIESVTVLDIKTGEVSELTNAQAQFAYRTSGIMKSGNIVLNAVFSLKKGDKAEISEKMNTLNAQRREKQPLEFPSAGSTFKRPEGYFAGKLIDDSGLRGYSVGDAQVSEKHCGFVVNKGNATAEDVLKLIDDVTKIVYDKFGVKLEPEVRIIGEGGCQ